MTIPSDIFASLVNRWNALPLWVRKGARDAAVGAVLAVTALNLGIPGTLVQAKAEALLAIFTAGPVVFAIVRVEVLPPLLAWLIGKLGLHYTKLGAKAPMSLVKNSTKGAKTVVHD
jgi:hypothetical protein